MLLPYTSDQLIRTIRRADRDGLLFAQARTAYPALAAYLSLNDLIASFQIDHAEGAYRERDELTRDLLSAFQSSRSTFWSSLLLLAFSPMLAKFVARISRGGTKRDEASALALVHFMEVINDFPLGPDAPDRIALSLRQRTQRRVYEALRCPAPDGEFDEENCVGQIDLRDVIGHEINPETAAEHVESCVRLLNEIAAGRIADDRLELLEHTCIRGMCLRRWVEALFPHLTGDAFEATYERLKRKRTRAVDSIRALFPEETRRRAIANALRWHSPFPPAEVVRLFSKDPPGHVPTHSRTADLCDPGTHRRTHPHHPGKKNTYEH